MLGDQPGPQQYLKAILMEEIELSDKSAALLIEEHGELDVQRHAMYCLWMIDQGKVHSPPAWSTASLKGDWSAPCGMPLGVFLLQVNLTYLFVVDIIQ